MPLFKDFNGDTISRDYYPGTSYRATVINRALDNHEFLIVNLNGADTPMYGCQQCKKLHTSAGIEGDHIDAKSVGGSDDPANLQMLCTICNRADIHHVGTGGVASRTRGAYVARREDYP